MSSCTVTNEPHHTTTLVWLPMNAGPSGFGGAPVTKGLVIAAVGATVVSNAARASHRQLPRSLVAASRGMAFKSPGELLFGCLLLYTFRVFERQTGSAKYGSYAAVVTGLSYVLQLGLTSLLPVQAPLAPVPLPLVYASFVPFLLDIPASNSFTVVGGLTLSDKAFVYMFGLQLLYVSGRKSLMVLVASLLAGVVYRLNLFHIKKFRLPGALVRLISKALGPLLADQEGPSIVMAGSTPAAAAAAGAVQGTRLAGYHPGPAAGRPAAAAAASPGLRHRGVAAAAAGGLQPGGGSRDVPAIVQPSQEGINTLVQMGFDQQQAAQALQQAGNDVQAAVALLLGQQH